MCKFKPHKIKKPKPACSCCNLKYIQGSVLSGFSIISEKKDNEENYTIIDIPGSELKNLRNLLDNLINE